MEKSVFDAAKAAADKFISDHGDQGQSYQTILLMCMLTAAPARTSAVVPAPETAPAHQPDAPAWLIDVLPIFAGKKVTSSAIMAAAGKPAGIGELRETGAILRRLVGQPSRSNGQTVFSIPHTLQHEIEVPPTRYAVADADLDDPYHPALPLAVRVTNFKAKGNGAVQINQIIARLGLSGTKEEKYTIHETLIGLGVHYENEKYHFIR